MEVAQIGLPVLIIALATQLAKLIRLPDVLVIPLVFLLASVYVLLLRWDAILVSDILEIVAYALASMGTYDLSKYAVELAVPQTKK